MIARMAGTVLWSAIVFIVVSVLVSLGVLWWTGGLLSIVVSAMVGRTEGPSEGRDDRN